MTDPLLISPNNILANALLRSIDVLRPRVYADRPERIEFVVGTQINHAPHLGTNLVQAATFALAAKARHEFGIESTVRFGALDNAPFEAILDPVSRHTYQRAYVHALGKDRTASLMDDFYGSVLDSLSLTTDIAYVVETYTDQQADPAFRAEFLHSLEHSEAIRWWLAPSNGVLPTRLPCPDCGWAEKYGERTRLIHRDRRGARFTAICIEHGDYDVHIKPEGETPYLGLATLYRNLVKERLVGRRTRVLPVMVKGGDWTLGCQLLDGALGAMDTPTSQFPMRVFTPQVLAPSGAKLSKSLLREGGTGNLPSNVDPWMLDTTAWDGTVDGYVDTLLWLVGELLADPRHFFRDFTVKELGRLFKARLDDAASRSHAHEMGIYGQYFDLIASGQKTIEIRVNDARRQGITEGSLIRFLCHGQEVLTRVTRIARYQSFEELFDHEAVASINPTSTREKQLALLRKIYSAEREALGILAIGIEPVKGTG